MGWRTNSEMAMGDLKQWKPALLSFALNVSGGPRPSYAFFDQRVTSQSGASDV